MLIVLAFTFNDQSYHLYADDLHICRYCKMSNMNEQVNLVNKDIAALTAQSVRHRLRINEVKILAILIGYPLLNNISFNSLKINNCFPEFIKKVKKGLCHIQ